MSLNTLFVRVGLGVGLAVALAAGQPVAQQQTPVKIPQPGVAEIMTLEGPFIRIAYNREGYVSLTYRVANESVGEEWMLLDMGATVRDGNPMYKLLRSSVTIDTPDGKQVPLATQADYLNVDLRKLEMRAQTVPAGENVNYFPPEARQACRIGFFAPPNSGRSFDEAELVSNRACVGRLYFRIPGGIKHGQHWLNVKFQNSLVRVPFRILTKEEEKTLSKTWKDIKKQVEDAFKKGK